MNTFSYILFVIVLLLGYYNRTVFEILYLREGLVIVIILLLGLILISEYRKISKKELKKISLFFIVVVLLRRYYQIFFIYLFSKKVDKYTRIRTFFWVSSCLYLGTIIYNIFINKELLVYIRNFENFSVMRYTLGFNNPNAAMMNFLPILFSGYYLYYEKNKKFFIMIFTGLIYLIFEYTYSRTGIVVYFLFFLIILLKDKYILKLKKIFYIEIFILTIFSINLSGLLKGSILDKFISGRFYLIDYYIKNYQITLFGNQEIDKILKLIPLDNIYANILFSYGIVGYIVMILVTTYIFIRLYKLKEFKGIRIFFIILIYGVMESTSFHHNFNVVYYLLYEIMMGKNNKR